MHASKLESFFPLDRRAALEAVVKSLGLDCVAEFNKHKSFQAAGQGCSGMGKMPLPRGLSEIGKMPGNMKKPPTASGSQKTLKKDLCSLPSSAASKMKSGTAEMSERTGMDVDGENAPGGTSDPRPVPYNRVWS